MSVKRRRKRRHYLRNVLRFLVLALVLSAVFVCLTMFTLSEPTVTGNYHESEKEVMDLVRKGPLKNNTLFLSLFYKDRKIKGDTFVESVDISYIKHDAVAVHVREKNLVGYVKYKDKYWYFDRDGRVLVESYYNESEYKALARGETLQDKPDPALMESSAADEVMSEASGTSSIAAGKKTSVYAPKACLTDEETYVGEETAEYDGDAHSEDDGDGEIGDGEIGEGASYDGDEETGEGSSDNAGENKADEYGSDGNVDGGENEDDGQDEMILIKPELIDEITPSPIPADESGAAKPAATPIPAQEVLVKEYKSEDTFAENYIPEITGLRFTEAVVGENLPARYASIYTALDALKTYAETNGVYPTCVDISATGDLRIHFNDVTVNLGKGEHIERRLAVLGQILNELLGRSGTMHLENYDGTESRLIFSKSEKNS